MFHKKKNRIRDSAGDRVLQGFTTVFLLLILFAVAYPVIYVLSCSFSSTRALRAARVIFLPVEFSTAGYKFVFQYKQVWIGYRNTLLYTVLGISITTLLNILTAYPLSRPRYRAKSFWMKFFYFTTLFHAGLIPTFIVKEALGLYNTIWAVVLAGALGVQHVVILRTAFKNAVPADLYDAAAIDGASQMQTLTKIALPLVKATLAVLILYSAVGCWNEYFNAMIYLQDERLYPLQLFLRDILVTAQGIDTGGITSSEMLQQVENGTEQVQYALIVVATVPLLALYAFIQKFFEKGVLVGSVKG